LDTRSKIVNPEAAADAARRAHAERKRVKLVSGYFDPLLAAHARRLAEIADPGGVLFAVVGEPERPILAARARAELVAALAVIDYVIIAGAAASDDLLKCLQPDEVYREEAADDRRAEDLLLHVHSRHS
jgi:bifunctional ADP-heptose synthase (sugar kinase/adenylyltransferase)